MYHMKFAAINQSLQVLSCIVYADNFMIIYAINFSQFEIDSYNYIQRVL